MPMTAKELLDAAHAAVPKVSGKDAQAMVANGAVIVDVRDGTEVAATGKAEGALHIPRGSLEFKACPGSPTADKNLSPDKTVILHCAGGGRAALAGKLLGYSIPMSVSIGLTSLFGFPGTMVLSQEAARAAGESSATKSMPTATTSSPGQ